MKDNISAFRTTQMMITGAFEVYHYREPYFKSLDFHNHDFYEAYLFLDGGVTYYIEDRAYDLVPGDLLIIPPGRMHRPAILDSTAVYERIVLWLNVDYLRLLDDPENTLQTMLSRFDGKDGYRLSLQDDTLSFSLSILHRLISLSTDCSPSGRFEQRALISAFLANVCSAQENAEKTARDAKVPELIPEVIRYINGHFTESLTLDLICAEFFVSKYHLIRKFKEYTNATVYDYILSKRIALARRLIRQGTAVTAAAAQCGFSDYSNFYKSFSAKTGMTPAQFRTHCQD